MSLEPLIINPDESSGRFDRFKLIGWWDQKRLAQARVLVVGAGALGNEIIKNLAMLGVGNVLIADLDRIENSNLSRSVLYREKDNGRFKAEVAAQAAREIYPAINVQSFIGNVVYDLGLGVYRWADVVLGGLDNREARLSMNRNCWKCNKPFIDGAIEQIQGTARFFAPDGPCYECTMSGTDWKLLQMRRSCNLLSKSEMQEGKTPTTPTISSIIAGVQCQEAVKHLHQLPTLAGKAWVFEGMSGDSYTVEFQRKAECYSHEILPSILTTDFSAATTTVRQVLGKAREVLGDTAELELAREVLQQLTCPRCAKASEHFCSLGKASADLAWCPDCRRNGVDVRRDVQTFHRIKGGEAFLDRTLEQIGVPAFDILIARKKDQSLGIELSADAPRVLGELWKEQELEWT